MMQFICEPGSDKFMALFPKANGSKTCEITPIGRYLESGTASFTSTLQLNNLASLEYKLGHEMAPVRGQL